MVQWFWRLRCHHYKQFSQFRRAHESWCSRAITLQTLTRPTSSWWLLLSLVSQVTLWQAWCRQPTLCAVRLGYGEARSTACLPVEKGKPPCLFLPIKIHFKYMISEGTHKLQLAKVNWYLCIFDVFRSYVMLAVNCQMSLTWSFIYFTLRPSVKVREFFSWTLLLLVF